MKDANELNHWIKTHGDLALDMVRIYLGIGLMAKAVYFIYHMDYLLNLTESAGSFWFAPAFLVHYVIMAHLVGGFMLAVGLITRGAAVVQLPVLAAALFYVHLPKILSSVEARQDAEFAGLVLFLLCLITFYGAGRFSLDYAMGRKMNAWLFHTGGEAPKLAQEPQEFAQHRQDFSR
jgi:putative oxidoreductase